MNTPFCFEFFKSIALVANYSTHAQNQSYPKFEDNYHSVVTYLVDYVHPIEMWHLTSLYLYTYILYFIPLRLYFFNLEYGIVFWNDIGVCKT